MSFAPEPSRISEDDLTRLEQVLDAIEGDGDVVGVVMRGEDGFASGLHLDPIAMGVDRRKLEAISRRVARTQARISASRKPFVAAIEGPCLDIGLELALACDVVLVADDPRVRVGLPQIELGLLPIGDALRRLPQRTGLETALELLVDGRVVGPSAALRMGLADALVHPAGLEAAARAAVRGRTAGEGGTKERFAWRPALRAADVLRRKRVVQRWQQQLHRRGRGLDAARLTLLDLVGRGIAQDDDHGRLAAAFSEAAVGDATLARVQLELRARTLRRRRPPEGMGAVNVQRLGIIGGGEVGAQLAVSAAQAGVTVRVREKSPPALGRALVQIERGVASDPDRPRRTRTRARLSGGVELDGFSTMDLILETVPEEVAIKRRVFAELEDCVRADAVLATHPRATPVSAIGSRMRHPERLVGVRLFRPLSERPLCEIVRTPQTSPRALATAVDFARRIDKTPVVVNDGPGFFTTRVLAAFVAHAGELVVDGYAIEDIDQGVRRAGWPVGPLRLLDEVGLPIAVRVGQVLSEALGERFTVPPAVEAMAATGRTFYRQGRGGEDEADPRVLDLLGASTRRVGDPDELGDRLTLVAALEAVRCLQEGVLDVPSDGDVAAVLGLGYPAARGGPFRHLGARGLAAIRSRLTALEDRFGTRYAAPSLLVELAQRGGDFSSLEVNAS